MLYLLKIEKDMRDIELYRFVDFVEISRGDSIKNTGLMFIFGLLICCEMN